MVIKQVKFLKKSIELFEKSTNKPQNKNLNEGNSKGSNSSKLPIVEKKRKVVKEIKTQKWKEISSHKSELKGFKLFG